MRYRPFSAAGQSISAVSLAIPLGLKAQQADALVCAALECGVNGYVIDLGDLTAAGALAGACAVVARRTLIVGVRTRLPVHRPAAVLRDTLAAGGLGHADILLLELGSEEAVDGGELAALDRLRTDRLATRVGLWGEGAGLDSQLSRFPFDVLATRYNLRSGWEERHRIKAATQRGMTILGFGAHIDANDLAGASGVAKGGLGRLFQRARSPQTHAYDFLRETWGWTAEQLTLAYALTEPALASVVTETADPRCIEVLASAVERELPPAAAAQIEIARFAA